MKRYFITGTDTNCGKTYVTCQLIRYFQHQQKQVMAIKPVASGCLKIGHSRVSEDEMQFRALLADNTHEIGMWRFKEAIAPHIAAKHENQMITASEVVRFCHQYDSDYVLIEGAGGLMVPLNTKETWFDVLQTLNAQVILVVGMRLGAINHALLSAYALATHQLSCVGWVANAVDPSMACLAENITAIEERLPFPLLATITHGGHLNFHSDLERRFEH